MKYSNIINESFNTPDTSYLGGKKLNWGDSDAIPFFVLKNGKIEYGKPKQTHKKYYDEKYGMNKVVLNKFINSIILQGRYWKDANLVSFWNMHSEDNMSTIIRDTISQICNLKKDCYVAYRNSLYKVTLDNNGFMSFHDVQDKENITLTPEKEQEIEKWWNSDMNFIKNAYIIRDNIGSDFHNRPLDDYEIFAATCHQMWADFIRSGKFKEEEVELYVSLRYHHKVSFKEGLSYFSQNLRNKMFGKNMPNIEDGEGYQSESRIEDMLNNLGVNRSQYDVVYYEDTGKPYSYNIHTRDENLAKKILQNAKKQDLDITRCNRRPLSNNNCMYSFRLREKYHE